MNTIKFQYRVPLNPNNKTGGYTDVVSLYEGYNVWHRLFSVKSKEEYADWYKKIGGPASNVVHHYINFDPVVKLNKEDYNCYFHYLTFWDNEGQLHKCIIFGVECFIMNDAGQTIDSFNA